MKINALCILFMFAVILSTCSQDTGIMITKPDNSLSAGKLSNKKYGSLSEGASFGSGGTTGQMTVGGTEHQLTQDGSILAVGTIYGVVPPIDGHNNVVVVPFGGELVSVPISVAAKKVIDDIMSSLEGGAGTEVLENFVKSMVDSGGNAEGALTSLKVSDSELQKKIDALTLLDFGNPKHFPSAN